MHVTKKLIHFKIFNKTSTYISLIIKIFRSVGKESLQGFLRA